MPPLALGYLEQIVPMQAGDAVILNAANSTIGQLLVQLCKVLRLRCIALVRDHGPERFDKTAAWLQGLGATAVFADAAFTPVRHCILDVGWSRAGCLHAHLAALIGAACELAEQAPPTLHDCCRR